jgi:tetraacyldisaccharide 4'-kinase
LELVAELPGVRHLQNRDRALAARQALAADPNQVLVLDDAFQHRRLARDLDIVLLDALAPFGYGHLLPRGLLREPVEGLARANVVALSRSDAVDPEQREQIYAVVRRLAPQAQWMELIHKPLRWTSASGEKQPLETLAGMPVAAFCGIGNPAGFRTTLGTLGIEPVQWLELPDHCAYDARSMRRLDEWSARSAATCVVCTRKDVVKIPRRELGGKTLWALEVGLEIVRGQQQLEAMLLPFVGSAGG